MRTLARVIGARAHETGMVQEPDLAKPIKNHQWAQKPRYTLAQLLYDGPPETVDDVNADDGPMPDVLANLPLSSL